MKKGVDFLITVWYSNQALKRRGRKVQEVVRENLENDTERLRKNDS